MLTVSVLHFSQHRIPSSNQSDTLPPSALPEVGPGKGGPAEGWYPLYRHVQEIADPGAERISAPQQNIPTYQHFSIISIFKKNWIEFVLYFQQCVSIYCKGCSQLYSWSLPVVAGERCKYSRWGFTLRELFIVLLVFLNLIFNCWALHKRDRALEKCLKTKEIKNIVFLSGYRPKQIC